MTSIKLHDDVYGHKSGETIDIADDKAQWAVANGYASLTSGGAAQQKLADVTDVKMKQHQQNPEARSDEPNKGLADQLADGDILSKSEVDPDPLPSNDVQVEVTNGKGKPEAAEKGKDALERKAEATDPSKAPEVTDGNPVVAPEVSAADAKAEAKLEEELKARQTQAAADDSAAGK